MYYRTSKITWPWSDDLRVWGNVVSCVSPSAFTFDFDIHDCEAAATATQYRQCVTTFNSGTETFEAMVSSVMGTSSCRSLERQSGLIFVVLCGVVLRLHSLFTSLARVLLQNRIVSSQHSDNVLEPWILKTFHFWSWLSPSEHILQACTTILSALIFAWAVSIVLRRFHVTCSRVLNWVGMIIAVFRVEMHLGIFWEPYFSSACSTTWIKYHTQLLIKWTLASELR